MFDLRIDGVVRAVQYGYAYRDTFLQVQEGYDPAGPDGIGNLLREQVFNTCIAEGLRTYDFMGEFTEHKRRWGSVRRIGSDVFTGHRSLKNRALFTRPVWPTGRYLREVLASGRRDEEQEPAPLHGNRLIHRRHPKAIILAARTDPRPPGRQQKRQRKQKSPAHAGLSSANLAERGGFEPPIGY